MTRRPPNTPPAIEPRNGLRQRQRADGSRRLWWEPTLKQREAGATPQDLPAHQPGHAQREATRLTREWASRIDGKPSPATRTGRSVTTLIEDYRQSRHFTTKRASTRSTRSSYTGDLRAIDAKWGPHPLALIDGVMMDRWYDALLADKGVFRARAILTMMRTLMKHAERRGWRPRGSNPVGDLEMQRPPPRARLGPWDELNALLAAARRLAMTGAGGDRITMRGVRLAIMLTALAGQRQTDVLAATPDQFIQITAQLPGMATPRKVWVWNLIRSKRDNAGSLALHPETHAPLPLQLRLAQGGPGTLLWDAATGNPFSKRLFWDRWRAVVDLATRDVPSVATLQWRDLRRTFGHLARAGGTEKGDVADVLGNTADTDATLAQVYMAPQLATAWRAASAIEPPQPQPASPAATKDTRKEA